MSFLDYKCQSIRGVMIHLYRKSISIILRYFFTVLRYIAYIIFTAKHIAYMTLTLFEWIKIIKCA